MVSLSQRANTHTHLPCVHVLPLFDLCCAVPVLCSCVHFNQDTDDSDTEDDKMVDVVDLTSHSDTRVRHTHDSALVLQMRNIAALLSHISAFRVPCSPGLWWVCLLLSIFLFRLRVRCPVCRRGGRGRHYRSVALQTSAYVPLRYVASSVSKPYKLLCLLLIKYDSEKRKTQHIVSTLYTIWKSGQCVYGSWDCH